MFRALAIVGIAIACWREADPKVPNKLLAVEML